MRYSPGATAGIAVGCAVAGIAVISAISLVVYLRQRRYINSLKEAAEKPPVPPEKYRRPESSAIVLSRLPKQSSTKDLRQGISCLYTSIDQWAFNYVHDDPVAEEALDAEKLYALLGNGTDAQYNKQWLTRLCGTPQNNNRVHMVIAYMSRVPCARIDPLGLLENTLLPGDVCRVYQQAVMGGTRRRDQLMLGFWRTLTATLFEFQYPLLYLADEDPRIQRVKKATADLTDVLRPLIKEDRFEDGAESVKETVTAFAVMGLRLFTESETILINYPPPPPGHIGAFPKIEQHDLDRLFDYTVYEAKFLAVIS
ncbi:hypothetical protein GGR52DRAFT_572386 [Hypoxylon sp. FL1284]|nr:hypothetical protein GGR52DRAFT_572386 [Hypoxylon sp. FL1284]